MSCVLQTSMAYSIEQNSQKDASKQVWKEVYYNIAFIFPYFCDIIGNI